MKCHIPELRTVPDKQGYDINWNVTENINKTTNIMDNPKYVSNNIYTGINLINDSLSTNHNVDIYDKVHRDMCEKWNHKEDMLNKLNEEWTMEHKENPLDIPPSTLDDIHKINDETYNMISRNNIYSHNDNDITSFDHLGSTNIPYNDLPTQNNIFQTNKLRTNISIDIHFNENNNNVENTNVTGDDHFENFFIFL
ncbi:erythrocyte membrane protein 1 (PfEMP1), exon 2, putative [Plasmodium reichenowi]|uniref:Erythrocyte membrane protein 1 (PfEMP1), exon 2, putative n=1 Tax=Plasmodium reichenowi TaxID=5854 RepID=A0A2P9D4M1_PLARE|nr:erythrocyte membrane protein 1 (PfEMP1), exon 2, putative [Plasmodium reichenowi]